MSIIELFFALLINAYATTAIHSSSIRLINSQYLGEAVASNQLDTYTDITLQSEYLKQGSIWGTRWQLFAGGSMDESEQTYLAISEFYQSYKRTSHSTYYFGRRKSQWSRFDEEWHMGIWQPQVRWDYIHPSSQGLIGLFLTEKGRDWRFELLLSPVFLPDQGPQFRVVDGRIQSANRWFWEPQLNAQISESDTPIHYTVHRPPEGDIVFNGGVATRVLLAREEDRGPWVQMAYAYKPLNQLHLGIDAKWKPAFIDAQIKPYVVRHHVVSLESGHKWIDGEFWLSFTGDFPNQIKLPEEWLESSLARSTFAGVHLAQDIKLPILGVGHAKASYLHRWDNGLDADNSVDAEVESSLDRFPFRQVVSFEWLHNISSVANNRWDFGIKYIYSIPDKGSLASLKLQWVPSAHSDVFLAMDILSSESDTIGGSSGFISRYRSNDRVNLGYSYVF